MDMRDCGVLRLSHRALQTEMKYSCLGDFRAGVVSVL